MDKSDALQLMWRRSIRSLCWGDFLLLNPADNSHCIFSAGPEETSVCRILEPSPKAADQHCNFSAHEEDSLRLGHCSEFRYSRPTVMNR
jgi:hypothetical protein